MSTAVIGIKVLFAVVLGVFGAGVALKFRCFSTRAVGIFAVASILASGVASVTFVDAYPWSNGLVLAVGCSAGLLLARVRHGWFGVALCVLAALDAVSFLSGVQESNGVGITSGPILFGNVTVAWSSGHPRRCFRCRSACRSRRTLA